LALPASGFIELAYTTFETAPTGDYTVNAYIVNDKKGNSLLGSVSVRVEEFLPDRLRIETRIGDGKLGGWMTPEDLSAHVGLYNLFGTAAADHRVAATMYLSPQAIHFGAFKDYAFTDPAAADESYEESLSECTTDGEGRCAFALDLKRFAGSSYTVSVYATGFELDGGRGVSGSARALVSPRPYFVGVKREGDLSFVKKDGEVGVRFMAVDKSVKAVDVDELRAVRVEERYVSVLQRQNNGSFAYQSVRKEITRGEEKLAIKSAGTRLKLDTSEPGTFIVSIRDKRDLEVSRVRYSVQGEANLSRSVERNAELELVLDKRDYAAGEPVSVAIKAPYAGSGLITIERDKVYAHKWFKTGTNATVQTIDLPPGIEGNGYVSVAFTRASASPEIFMSPLSYGVVGFSVSQKARTVAIQLESPELVKPGDKLNVRYSADRPTKMVVWGVDEGILQVAHYETPNPLAFFFEKRALEVRTKQILDLILPEHHVVAALMKQGGDGDGGASKNLNPFRRKHDAPVAFWSGIIDAGPETKTFTYQVPDTFNGTMRVMAAALAPDAVGVAQKKTTVRGPFVISPNAPLFIAPGDTAEMSVAVANNVEGSGKDAKVDVTLQAADGVKVLGDVSQTLTIAEGREGAVRFKLQGTTKLGSTSLKLTARSGSASATLTTDTSVRPASAFASQVLSGIVASGGVDVALTRRLLPEYAKHEVTVSSAPLALARSLQTYVENFPHLCTEQVVSAAVPSLLLRQFPELASKTKQTKPAVENALDVLQSRQNDDGSFGYWTASSRVSDYASLYATHFLIETTERGLPVAAELKKRALANARELARRPLAGMPSARLRAFAVYLLARSGEQSARELAELRDFLRKDQGGAWKSDITVAFLAAAYRLARDESEASSLIRLAEMARDVPGDAGTFYNEQTYAAQLFYVLVMHFPERLGDFDKKLIERMVGSAGGGRANTIGSAWTLYALAAYARSDAAKNVAAKATVAATTDDGKKQNLALHGTAFPTGEVSLDTKTLHISNDADLPLFYAVTVSGFDREPATAAETHGIEIIRSYEDDKGKTMGEVAIGDTVSVHVKMRAVTETVHDVAVVELLPAGFDLVLDGDGGRVLAASSTWQPEYIDAREDRAVFYGDLTKDVKEVIYRLRATTRGAFVVPPTHAAAMYAPDVRGSSARAAITVVGK
ncbi:MAG: alpha-2-macroglobulin, partial [Myxococcota bacterium]